MEDKELKETLNLIMLKLEQLSAQINLVESKLGASQAVVPAPKSAVVGAGDIRQDIDKMRADLMKKHQRQMQELKNKPNVVKEGVNVLVNPPSELGE